MKEGRPDNIANVVRGLQLTLIDGQRGLAPPSMLDCAAHMLLYFDVQKSVHRIALQFLLERFEASRTNLGYGSPAMHSYLSSATEVLPDPAIPIAHRPVPNHIEAIQRIWCSSEPVCFDPNDIPGFEQTLKRRRNWLAAWSSKVTSSVLSVSTTLSLKGGGSLRR
jgi:hypothetical protein